MHRHPVRWQRTLGVRSFATTSSTYFSPLLSGWLLYVINIRFQTELPKQPGKFIQGQSSNIIKRTFYLLNKLSALTLNGICAGFVHWLTGSYVIIYFLITIVTHFDVGYNGCRLNSLTTRINYGYSAKHLMAFPP